MGAVEKQAAPFGFRSTMLVSIYIYVLAETNTYRLMPFQVDIRQRTPLTLQRAEVPMALSS